MSGTLFIVATPIGNLGDISVRATEILASVDMIAAEDTRHSSRLLQYLQISKPMIALHEHNEQKISEKLAQALKEGKQIAYISDAGTPLISDPGRNLVQLAHEYNIQIVPIPGPCALVAALSAAGFSANEFMFLGFLPPKATHRMQKLATVKELSCTLVFYEAPHRILDTLEDMNTCFGPDRPAFIARELTKIHESLLRGTLQDLLELMTTHKEFQQGEFVVIVEGAPSVKKEITPEVEQLLKLLLTELKLNSAVRIAAEITKVNKNTLYDLGLNLSKSA